MQVKVRIFSTDNKTQSYVDRDLPVIEEIFDDEKPEPVIPTKETNRVEATNEDKIDNKCGN